MSFPLRTRALRFAFVCRIIAIRNRSWQQLLIPRSTLRCSATAQISTKDGVAKIEKMIDAGVKFNASFMATRYGKAWTPKIAELGPGGLGTTKGKNNYKCTGTSLEYQSSRSRGDADCTVKFTKVKP